MGNTETDCGTLRDWLRFSIYDKLMSLSSFFSFSAFSSARLAYSAQSNDLSVSARPLATTHSTGDAAGRRRKGESNGNNQCYYI